MAKAAVIDPFACATVKPTGASKKKAGNTFVAHDITTYDGRKFAKQDVIEAITSYAQGHKLKSQGEAMEEVSRPVVISVARTEQAARWLKNGSRPENPKLHINDDGTGPFTTVVFMDKAMKMDEDSYSTFANLVGAKEAEANTIRRNDFSINPDILQQKCKVIIDGKQQEMIVLDALSAILKKAFSVSPEILASLFHITPRFETTKGLIDKGLQLVARDQSPASAIRLAEFLEFGRFTTQIKPGGSDDE